MIYHGIDMIEVARVRRAAERWGERFLRRVYTARELADCGVSDGAPRYESLAARWAAKEAAAKALGAGLSGLGGGERPDPESLGLLRFQELEVARELSGRPTLQLHGGAAALAARHGISALALSLSHTREHAIASVIGLGAWAADHGVE
jgi:holo-[acyl-carrier protein] synthase